MLNQTHHANDGLKLAGRQAQASCHAPNAGVGGGHKGVGPKVEVQHGGIGSLHQDTLAALVGLIHVVDGVAHKWQHLQGQAAGL